MSIPTSRHPVERTRNSAGPPDPLATSSTRESDPTRSSAWNRRCSSAVVPRTGRCLHRTPQHERPRSTRPPTGRSSDRKTLYRPTSTLRRAPSQGNQAAAIRGRLLDLRAYIYAPSRPATTFSGRTPEDGRDAPLARLPQARNQARSQLPGALSELPNEGKVAPARPRRGFRVCLERLFPLPDSCWLGSGFSPVGYR
jgi:hypothetical protein